MSSSDGHSRPELSLVMPAYNEAACIADVLESWSEELDRLSIDYEIRVYDDGSSDATFARIQGVASKNERIVAVSQSNVGHGPTVMRGYRQARGEWILQVDSDDEIPTSEFVRLWERRDSNDFILGRRTGRNSGVARQIVSAGSRLVCRALFGASVWDVNSPFRLMRRESVEPIFMRMPDGILVPNVVLSGLVSRAKLRVLEIPIAYRERRTGRSTLGSWRLWKFALRSLLQTIALSRRATLQAQ